MKTIGMIGGLGWLSTADYYRLLCKGANEHFASQGVDRPLPTPHIIIESLNMNATRKLRGVEGKEKSWVEFESLFRQTFKRLQAAGADFGIIASNTPHMRIKGITRDLGFPVISILDTTAQAVLNLNARRALVLGTTVTMKSPVYADALHGFGVDTFAQLPEDQISALARLIDSDLYQGNIDGAREHILELCKVYVQHETDIVCLACTELSLAFPEHQDTVSFEDDGVIFVNTTVAHVAAALKEALYDNG